MPSVLFCIVLLSILGTGRGFYEKGSDVVTLKKSNWRKEVLSSEYLYVVEFYREGCGYCQLLTPIYEKLAASLKHTVKVGAVNTEKEGQLAGDHGDPSNPISGVPTIKLFKPGKGKKDKEVVVYNGERKAKAMADFMTYHMPSHVKTITASTFDKIVGSSKTPSALLFTDKSSTSPLYKALSTEYHGRMLLVQVNKKESTLLSRFNITTFPSLVVVAPGVVSAPEIYTGKISFTSINMFLWKFESKLAKQQKQQGKEL